eukprot:6194428-Pleurochrysis_carterae.AAC.3
MLVAVSDCGHRGQCAAAHSASAAPASRGRLLSSTFTCSLSVHFCVLNPRQRSMQQHAVPSPEAASHGGRSLCRVRRSAERAGAAHLSARRDRRRCWRPRGEDSYVTRARARVSSERS